VPLHVHDGLGICSKGEFVGFFNRLLFHGEILETVGPIADWSNLLESGSVAIVRAGEGSDSTLLVCVKQRLLLAWTTSYFVISKDDVEKLQRATQRVAR
jgi:hypothetical protein